MYAFCLFDAALSQHNMFSAAISAARCHAPGAARSFSSSAARTASRKFFVGGNWKCNGSLSKVWYLSDVGQ